MRAEAGTWRQGRAFALVRTGGRPRPVVTPRVPRFARRGLQITRTGLAGQADAHACEYRDGLQQQDHRQTAGRRAHAKPHPVTITRPRNAGSAFPRCAGELVRPRTIDPRLDFCANGCLGLSEATAQRAFCRKRAFATRERFGYSRQRLDCRERAAARPCPMRAERGERPHREPRADCPPFFDSGTVIANGSLPFALCGDPRARAVADGRRGGLWLLWPRVASRIRHVGARRRSRSLGRLAFLLHWPPLLLLFERRRGHDVRAVVRWIHGVHGTFD